MKMKQKIFLQSEFMTLGQLLKEANIIASGGQAKWYLAENAVYVNGELENRRGRKLYAGMMVETSEGTFFISEPEKNEEADHVSE
jgi:ribosome-associated protein